MQIGALWHIAIGAHLLLQVWNDNLRRWGSFVKAVIVGGGIGGLTAALCLHTAGWEPVIVERAAALEDLGAGIQLGPNAMKVMQQLGLETALIAAGFQPEAIELRMGISGMDLIRAPLGQTATQKWGAPYLHIHRADLVRVLADALKTRAPETLKLGAGLTHYTQTDTQITAHLSDGSALTADMLIGADGIHSAVRTQMLGPDNPVFTGNVAWRAVVPVEQLGADCPRPVAGAWMGRGKHAVTYLLRGGTLANFVGVVERDDWQKEGWREQGSREEALADFDGWHPTITQLISQTDTLYRWALFDRKPNPHWVDGRAALMGDAAHPMLPFMAQGAAMAIEDAWALAACVSAQTHITDALPAYQNLRYARASKMQAASRANAKTFHQRTGLGRLKTYGPMWLAGRAAPSIGLMKQDWVYSYDITARAPISPDVLAS